VDFVLPICLGGFSLERFREKIFEWEGRRMSIESYIRWLGKGRRVLDLDGTNALGVLIILMKI